MIKKNAFICLAAGKSQLNLIKKAIKLGRSIISIDQNKNSIGFQYSTEKIIVSTDDHVSIINELRKKDQNIIMLEF